MILAIVSVLPVPVAPSSVWWWRPRAEPVGQPLDRLRLVAGGLEVGDEIEVGHARKDSTRAPVSNERSMLGEPRCRTRVVGRTGPNEPYRRRDPRPTLGRLTTRVRRSGVERLGPPRRERRGAARPRPVRASGRPPVREEGSGGQSLVEFSLVLMPLFFILLGIIQFGFIFNAYVTMTNAAREAARIGTVYIYDRGLSKAQNDLARNNVDQDVACWRR